MHSNVLYNTNITCNNSQKVQHLANFLRGGNLQFSRRTSPGYLPGINTKGASTSQTDWLWAVSCSHLCCDDGH